MCVIIKKRAHSRYLYTYYNICKNIRIQISSRKLFFKIINISPQMHTTQELNNYLHLIFIIIVVVGVVVIVTIIYTIQDIHLYNLIYKNNEILF